MVWRERKVPQRRRDALIKALHKNNIIECWYYRRVPLVAHAGKVFIKIAAARLGIHGEVEELLLRE